MTETDLSTLVDAKLTRTEVIDLVIHGMTEGLRKQMDDLDAAMRLIVDQRKSMEPTSTAVGNLTTTVQQMQKVRIDSSYYPDDKYIFVEITGRIPVSKEYVKLQEQWDDLHKKHMDLRAQVDDLSEGRQARMRAMVDILGATGDGRKLLGALDGIIGKGTKLLLAAKKK